MPHIDDMIIEKSTGPRSYYIKTEEGTETVTLLSKGKNFNVSTNDDIDINEFLS